MSQSRAIRSAFTEVFREPVIYLTELVWRSVTGATAILLCAYAALAYLNSLEVTDLDMLGLADLVPGTAAAAVRHIFQGSGPALLRAVSSAAVGSMLVWWLACSLGRSASLAALLRLKRPAFATIASLNFARGFIAMLACIGLVGAYEFAWSRAQISSSDHDRTKLYLLFLPLIVIIGWAWSTVSWYLKVALIPAAQSGAGLTDAIQIASATVRRHGRQFLWVGFVTGLARASLFFVSAVFALFVLSVALQSQAAIGLAIVAINVLACMVAFTFVQLVQLAAYVRIFSWAAKDQRAAIAVVV